MIELGADDWNRCFYVACRIGHVHIVELILQHGSDYCNIDQGFIVSCSNGHLSIVKKLLATNKCVNWVWACTLSVKNNHTKVKEYVMEYGRTHINKS